MGFSLSGQSHQLKIIVYGNKNKKYRYLFQKAVDIRIVKQIKSDNEYTKLRDSFT